MQEIQQVFINKGSSFDLIITNIKVNNWRCRCADYYYTIKYHMEDSDNKVKERFFSVPLRWEDMPLFHGLLAIANSKNSGLLDCPGDDYNFNIFYIRTELSQNKLTLIFNLDLDIW